MNRKTRLFAVVLSVVLMLVLAGVAYAITIVIDGQKDADWSGIPGQTPGVANDPQEPTIDARYNIKQVLWTNDALGVAPWGHMYWLVETFANYDNIYPPLAPQIIICLDVDNNTGTGTAAVGYCNNMVGVDRRITANVRLGTVSVERWNSATSAFVVVGKPAGGMRDDAYYDPSSTGIAQTPYIEIGVDLLSLGIINSATCLSTMPAAIYYDNGILDPEDTVPDTGTVNMGCGSPTAITLSNLEAHAADNNGTAVLILIGTATLALGVGGTAALRRRKQHTL